MKTIPSFTVDHLRLKRGIYVSSKYKVGDETLTVFDIRMTEPNRQPHLSQTSIHTIEHLAATYLRNEPVWKDRVIYWGPMGCLTGNYLILVGDLKPEDIVQLMKDTFGFIAGYEGAIPGAAAKDCGSWELHDLAGAREDAARYLHEVLEVITDENLNYPG